VQNPRFPRLAPLGVILVGLSREVVARVAKVAAERLDDVEDALGVPSGLQVGEVRELRVELGAITRCVSGTAGRISLLVWMRNFGLRSIGA